ncbi:MAG: CotH kinase family protein [Lachnospiraceae bacterium]|nr:CotH kinase family protein [Lachnospiraceae bacterium]
MIKKELLKRICKYALCTCMAGLIVMGTACTKEKDAGQAENEVTNGGTAESTPEPAKSKNDGQAKEPAEEPQPTNTPASSETVPENTPTQTLTPTPTPVVFSEMLIFSRQDKFSEKSFELELKYDSLKEGDIYYTLDGSLPTKEATAYTGPIALAAPEAGVKAYIVRAICYAKDGSATNVATSTYFVGEGVRDYYDTLVFSIVSDPYNLYDDEYGILSQKLLSSSSAKGEDYERPAYIEALNSDGSVVFEQDAGIRIVGGGSKTGSASPSIKLYAKKKYTPDRGYFPFSLFETPRYDKEGKVVKKYGKLTLRTDGDDWQNTLMRDALANNLLEAAGFENYEASMPAIVYVNGEYYGLMWLHEAYCEEYFRRKYGEVEGEVVMVEPSEQGVSVQRNATALEKTAVSDYKAFYKMYANSDLTNDDLYEELCKIIDVEDYLRYYAFELYVANTDWPDNNFFAYRYYANDGKSYTESGVYDGRWRYLVHDTDYAMGIYWNSESNKNNGADANTWSYVTDPSDRRYAPLFTSLMKRDDCKKYFVEYTKELINGALSAENFAAMVNDLNTGRQKGLALQMEYFKELKEANKAGESAIQIWINENNFNKNVEKLIRFGNERAEYALKYITELFGDY